MPILRLLIQRWDSGHIKWGDALASLYGIGATAANDGPTPMEVDAVTWKGKGKESKGRGKYNTVV